MGMKTDDEIITFCDDCIHKAEKIIALAREDERKKTTEIYNAWQEDIIQTIKNQKAEFLLENIICPQCFTNFDINSSKEWNGELKQKLSSSEEGKNGLE